MTDKAAADLRIQLDAMRLARAEDAKLCARLTARVAELEEDLRLRPSLVLLGKMRDLLREAYGWAPTDLMVRITSVLGAGHQHEPTIAEGTRDETAARCSCCRVPAAAYDHLGRCGMCASEVPP